MNASELISKIISFGEADPPVTPTCEDTALVVKILTACLVSTTDVRLGCDSFSAYPMRLEFLLAIARKVYAYMPTPGLGV